MRYGSFMDNVKTCPVCGATVPTSINLWAQRIYCSSRCRKINRERVKYKNGKNKSTILDASKELFYLVCPICSEKFISPFASKIYCSRKCQNASYYSRRKGIKKTRPANNKQDQRSKSKKWREKYPDKYKRQIHLYKANPERKKRRLESSNKARSNLADYVVARMLRLPVSQVPKEIIGLKRVQVQITRTLKEQQNEASTIKRRKR